MNGNITFLQKLGIKISRLLAQRIQRKFGLTKRRGMKEILRRKFKHNRRRIQYITTISQDG